MAVSGGSGGASYEATASGDTVFQGKKFVKQMRWTALLEPTGRLYVWTGSKAGSFEQGSYKPPVQ